MTSMMYPGARPQPAPINVVPYDAIERRNSVAQQSMPGGLEEFISMITGGGHTSVQPGVGPSGPGQVAPSGPANPLMPPGGGQFSGGQSGSVTTVDMDNPSYQGGGYNPSNDPGLQSALTTGSMGINAPQAPPDVMQAIKRRKIIESVQDPLITQIAAQYGIIPPDVGMRKIQGY